MKTPMLIYILAIFVVAAVLLIFYMHHKSTNQIPAGYVQVKSYVEPKPGPGQLQCAALLPQCGVCDDSDGGVVANGKCYVPKNSPFANL